MVFHNWIHLAFQLELLDTYLQALNMIVVFVEKTDACYLFNAFRYLHVIQTSSSQQCTRAIKMHFGCRLCTGPGDQ